MELIIDNVLNIGAEEFYRANRYKLFLSVILVNSSDEKAFDILYEHIRQSDIVQQLTPELTVVILTHTNHKNTMLFINNIKPKFDFTYTAGEFKGDEFSFIKKLFLDNKKSIV